MDSQPARRRLQRGQGLPVTDVIARASDRAIGLTDDRQRIPQERRFV
jgi:hypothetical protein